MKCMSVKGRPIERWLTKIQHYASAQPVGTEFMEDGIARDGSEFQASVSRIEESRWKVDVCFAPENFGAEPFKLRREFTAAAYVGDFIHNL